MKKLYSIFAVAAIIGAVFTSCSKEKVADEINVPANQEVKFNFTVCDPIPGTRAVKSGWEKGDKINLWFNDTVGSQPDLILTFDGTNWNAGKLRAPITFEDEENVKCIYEGFNDFTNKFSLQPFEFKTYGEDGSGYTPHKITLGENSVFQIPLTIRGSQSYGFDGSTVTATLFKSGDFNYINSVQVVVSGLNSANADKYTLSCDKLFSIVSFGNGMNDYSPIGTAIAGVPNADGAAFYFDYPASPSTAKDYTFTLTDYTGESPVVKKYTAASKSFTTDFSNTTIIGIKLASSNFAAEPKYTKLDGGGTEGTWSLDDLKATIKDNGSATIALGIVSNTSSSYGVTDGPNYYLSIDNDKVKTLEDKNVFTIEPGSDDKYTLKTQNGQYVQSGNNGGSATLGTIDNAAQFSLEAVTPTDYAPKYETADMVRFDIGGTYLNCQDRTANTGYRVGLGGFSAFVIWKIQVSED